MSDIFAHVQRLLEASHWSAPKELAVMYMRMNLIILEIRQILQIGS